MKYEIKKFKKGNLPYMVAVTNDNGEEFHHWFTNSIDMKRFIEKLNEEYTDTHECEEE